MRDKIIRIQWSEPVLLEDAVQDTSLEIMGLYYITRLFGTNETSLYIGKSEQSVRRRLIAHTNSWLQDYRGKKYVRIGKIVYPRNPDANVLDHAESALIFNHSDKLVANVDKMSSYTYETRYRIENIGDSFELTSTFKMVE